MKKQIRILVLTVLLAAFGATAAFAERPAGWRGGLNFAHSFRRNTYDRENDYMIGLEGTYRYNFASRLFIDPSVSLFWQHFPKYEEYWDYYMRSSRAKNDIHHPFGIGIEPKFIFGVYLGGDLELSTGPSFRWNFIHHASRYTDYRNYMALWNFRLGHSFGRHLHGYVEYQQHLTHFDDSPSYGHTNNYIGLGLSWCF